MDDTSENTVHEIVQQLDRILKMVIMPEDAFYYVRLVQNINIYISHYSENHKNDGVKFIWDPVIVSWAKGIIYHGGKSTYGIIRGKGNKRVGKGEFFTYHFQFASTN